MMKKFLFVSLILVIILSGCLLQPQVVIKSASVSGNTVLIDLHSNKAGLAEIEVFNVQNALLCSNKIDLKQGNNSIELTCSLTESKVIVKATLEGAVFSKELNVEFDESDAEARIISLAQTTLEGEALEMYVKNFAKADECNAELYVENMKKFYEKAMQYDDYGVYADLNFDVNESQMQSLDEQINLLKPCKLSMEKKITDLGNSMYSVSYSMVVGGDCSAAPYASSMASQEDIVVIEVDLKDNSVKVTKGAIESSGGSQEEIKAQLDAYSLLGGCMKLMMLGVSPFYDYSDISQQEIQASGCLPASAGNLSITGFWIEPTYIVLHIQNTASGSVELTGFTGSPFELSWVPVMQNIDVGETGIYNLDGEFGEIIGTEINEDITINYTLNNMDFSEMFNCSGVLEDILETLENENAEEIQTS